MNDPHSRRPLHSADRQADASASEAGTPLTVSQPSRREFLKRTAGASAALSLGISADLASGAFASGNEILKVGLVGCGGRGTGAAHQALLADPNTKLVALGDAFEDRLVRSLKNLSESDVADRVVVDDDHRFVGFDAYQGVIAASDVVLLATPPKFRPEHLRACVDAGKHVFVEKPVAVDAPGVRSVLEACAEAKSRNLTIVSGLAWRYETGLRQTMRQLHEGAVGDIVAVEATRYAGGLWVHPRQPDQTDIEYQMRNWYYFTWLSGDFIVEQFVHELDMVAWLLNDQYPTRCYCAGGRQTRTGKNFGNIFDHFNAVFQYENGVKLYAGTRQQPGCSGEYGVYAMGTQGACHLTKYTITGAKPWKWGKRTTVAHQLEHDAMYAALRGGRTINNGNYMAKSTMMAILARMSAYTGKTLTWDQAMASEDNLGPERYDWDMEYPEPRVAVPGVTPFV
jgi:predicted dehydrogenase